MGLVNRVVPREKLRQTAGAMARKIASFRPGAVRLRAMAIAADSVAPEVKTTSAGRAPEGRVVALALLRVSQAPVGAKVEVK